MVCYLSFSKAVFKKWAPGSSSRHFKAVIIKYLKYSTSLGKKEYLNNMVYPSMKYKAVNKCNK